MKQLLFILFIIVVTFPTVQVQSENSYENTTWNVIRERLFSGENTKAYRYEEDIRLQVTGARTQQDSAIFIQLVEELNELMETVEITLVDSDPNFRVTMKKETGDTSGYISYAQVHSGYKISKVYIQIGINESLTGEQLKRQIYFTVIRQLVRLYVPQNGSSGYNGIFDAPDVFRAKEVEFKDIDKDLLKKLYSNDFYKQLKRKTIEKYDYQHYLELRYNTLLNDGFTALKVALLIFGFLFFFSKASKRKQNPGLILYIKQRLVFLFILPFFYSILHTSGNLILFSVTRPLAFLINYLVTLIMGIFVLIYFYFGEPIILKRIPNFIAKQAFIVLTTISSAFIVSVIFGLLYNPVANLISLPQFSFSNLFPSLNSSLMWLILMVAILRVLYNVINYRIQSMVNQKDVEIAKMKELKNQAELNALHSRINPHFLYNSLNSIASLAHVDADKTEHMATGLSELFRYSINKENKTYVTVAEELEMVTKYLEIEKTRFGKRLIYTINADEITLEKQIPKFMIQPLVENAIKHGLSKMKDVGKIVVEVKQLKKDLNITIFDNGPEFPSEPVGGYGLQNLHDKLQIIYGKDAVINWENGANKHIKITLKNQFPS